MSTVTSPLNAPFRICTKTKLKWLLIILLKNSFDCLALETVATIFPPFKRDKLIFDIHLGIIKRKIIIILITADAKRDLFIH